MNKTIDNILIILFISIITILIILGLGYDSYGIYKDILITFISLFSFLLLLFDKFRKKWNIGLS